jgi:uncharacterized protein YecT (DUF1311 family)
MRAIAFFLASLWLPAAALAETNIHAVCYEDCAASTHSTPEYNACAARAADNGDAALNHAYKTLQDAVRADGKEMGQSPDTQLGYLKDAQKQWIAFRDANCTFEDSLAFGGTSLGGNSSSCLCVLSYQRIDDFARIKKDVMGTDE